MLWRNWPENGDYKLNKRTSGVVYVNIRMFCVCLIHLFVDGFDMIKTNKFSPVDEV
jgi:hypothetical protein